MLDFSSEGVLIEVLIYAKLEKKYYLFALRNILFAQHKKRPKTY